jgi:hypothetical protein
MANPTTQVAFKTLAGVTDPQMKKLQDNIKEFTDQISPQVASHGAQLNSVSGVDAGGPPSIANGTYLSGITLNPGSNGTDVSHNLGRVLAGWKIVDKLGSFDAWRSTAQNKVTPAYLSTKVCIITNSNTAQLVSMWVF